MLIFKDNRVLFADNSFKNAVMVGDMQISYTLKSEDVTKQERVECTPYVSHKDNFDENGYAKNTKSRLKVYQNGDGLNFFVSTLSDELSEFGIYLPFNFMSKKGGGKWQEQYLFNSPYQSIDNRYVYCYFSSPSGRNLMLVATSEVDGWKMDYSPYVGGHFFDNFKILANFDKAYSTGSERKEFSFSLFEVESFEKGLEKLSKTLNLPVAYYSQNAVKQGEKIKIHLFGNCDGVYLNEQFFKTCGSQIELELTKLQDNIITPVYNGVKGLNCTVYCYKSLPELYNASMNTVCESDLRATDGNLCEHQCWASAMLRYMLRYGKVEKYEDMVTKLLDIITEQDEEKAKIYHDITIFNKKQQNGLPPYHIYGSTRIQEQCFGITILLDAYKYFKNQKYLDYAINALNTFIDTYQAESGAIIRGVSKNSGMPIEYSTVCCLIIPIIDMANFFKDKDESLYQKYKNSASKLAHHLYLRGYTFPTETDETSEAEEEMEDGSISCTALSLLYYCAKIEKVDKYVDCALDILKVHENWVTQTPIAQMYRSSLRWWETRWEGDKDGPALCMGHAWSIWRAEADYWAYAVTGDKKFLEKARGGFFGNMAKINEKGQSYAIYQADYITGGGFLPGVTVKYKVVNKYPNQTDSGLSRYLWIRYAEITENNPEKGEII